MAMPFLSLYREEVIMADCITLEMERDNYFDPMQTFSCGQAFHWDLEEDGSITTVSGSEWLNILKKEDRDLWTLSTVESVDYWKDYFDFGRDYGEMIKRIEHLPMMKEATEYGKGIRILRQEVFETMMTFIISANNHIPRITKAVKDLSRLYGREIEEFRGRKLYSFPTPLEFGEISQRELREIIKVGYRDKHLVATGKRILSGDFDIEQSIDLNTDELRKELLKLPGVGPKVADCILLFAYSRMEVFPVDVWIHRIMEEQFFMEKGTKKEIHRKSVEIFGEDAGFAQQYLFYYGRAKKY